jgi:hypothetical protein
LRGGFDKCFDKCFDRCFDKLSTRWLRQVLRQAQHKLSHRRNRTLSLSKWAGIKDSFPLIIEEAIHIFLL